jgi:hypothetical protein
MKVELALEKIRAEFGELGHFILVPYGSKQIG